MLYRPTAVTGCHIVELEPIADDRGFFSRAWCAAEATDSGSEGHVAQVNMSRTDRAGMVRGLHWQDDPHGEEKFVRCIAGRIFDVCVDMRAKSPTYGAWAGVELSPLNRLAFSVPAGCAHGYQALESGSEVLYLVSTPYAPGCERGLRWDDEVVGIEWPITVGVEVSTKDASWPSMDSLS